MERGADPARQVAVEGWDPADALRRESLFGQGNGVLFLRACAPEQAFGAARGPHHYAGMYLAGCYNSARRVVAGQETGITALVNLPFPFGLGLRRDGIGAPGDAGQGDGEWFSPDTADYAAFRQTLDLARGIAGRAFRIRHRAGGETRIAEERFASMADPTLAVLRWEITPLDWDGPVTLRHLLPAAVENARVAHMRDYEGVHADVAPARLPGACAVRVRTRDGAATVQVAVWLSCGGAAARPAPAGDRSDGRDRAAPLAQEVRADARRGRTLTVVLMARVTEAAPAADGAPLPAEAAAQADPVDPPPSWEAARREHLRAWEALWGRAGLSAPGSPSLERDCRFGAFHLLQTASPHSARRDTGMPGRGWQETYFGHAFWDDILVFPFYSMHAPAVAAGLLDYRHRRLGAARAAARREGLPGAMYPWRSARTGGEETPAYQYFAESGRWRPDSTRLQRHVGAAIAFNAWRHFLATGDRARLAGRDGEMIVEIARFWAGAARRGADGRHGVPGVIGPDEYHDAYPGAREPGLDDNAYTNAMAAWTLFCAAELPQHLDAGEWRALRERTGLRDQEADAWRAVGGAMRLPVRPDGTILQFAGFDRLRPPDADPVPRRDPSVRLDWWLDAQGESVNAYQLTKQADVLMLFHLLGRDGLQELFARMGHHLPEGWYARTVRYDLERITHESSLSRAVCAGALACMDGAASWKEFRHALRTDLDPGTGHGAGEGLHLGAMSGVWDVLQRHYLGLQLLPGGTLRFEPHPPDALDDVRMPVRVRGALLELRLRGEWLEVAARPDGAGIGIVRGGEASRLEPGQSVRLRCR